MSYFPLSMLMFSLCAELLGLAAEMGTSSGLSQGLYLPTLGKV